MTINLTDKELGYIAGMIDGDGCIGVVKHKTKEYNGTRYIPRCFITNTNMEVLMYIKQKLGGEGNICSRTKGGNRKRVHDLVFRSNFLREFLPKILPEFRIKKRQAEIVIELLSLVEGKVCHSYKLSDYDRMEQLYMESRKLNRKGIFNFDKEANK